MQKRPTLTATKRTILGKQIKTLRRDGLLPANVYGKGLESTAIQIVLKDFQEVYKEAGQTGVIDLTVEGEVRPVLIKNLQMKYPLHVPLHADFYQVNLKEKVKAMIPIEIIGEAKAVTEKIGTIIQTLNEAEVESLPTDLPEKIEVNVEPLAALDEQITVGDLKLSSAVEVLTDPGQVIVKIIELAAPEPEPEPEPAAEGEEGAVTEGEEAGKEEGGEKSGDESTEKAEDLPAGTPRGDAGKAGKKE